MQILKNWNNKGEKKSKFTTNGIMAADCGWWFLYLCISADA